MAIAHRVTWATSTTSNSQTSLTVNLDAAVQDRDVMFAWVGVTKVGTIAAVITPPSGGGWTNVFTTTDTSSDASTLALYVKAAQSEPGSQVWQKDAGSGRMIVTIQTFSEVNTTTPVVGSEFAGAALPGPNTTARSTPSITTAGTRWIAAAYFGSAVTTFGTYSSPQTERADTATSNASLAVTDSATDVASGAIAARTAVASLSSQSGATAIVAVNPRTALPPARMDMRLPTATLVEGNLIVHTPARMDLHASDVTVTTGQVVVMTAARMDLHTVEPILHVTTGVTLVLPPTRMDMHASSIVVGTETTTVTVLMTDAAGDPKAGVRVAARLRDPIGYTPRGEIIAKKIATSNASGVATFRLIPSSRITPGPGVYEVTWWTGWRVHRRYVTVPDTGPVALLSGEL